MEENLKNSELFMERAKRSFERALKAFEVGLHALVVHEAYYTAFHASKAYLFLFGADPETHKGLKQLMNMYLFRDEKFRRLARVLDELFSLRQSVDYDALGDLVDEKIASRALELAKTFLKNLEELIENIKKELL